MSRGKSLAVAQYLLGACERAGAPAVTPMQLLKLAYIAHGYMLGKHGRPLLDEAVEAWQYGPVVPRLYHAVKAFRSSPVESVPGARQAIELDREEREVMDTVARTYGKHSGVVLSAATHKPGTPWEQTWRAFGKSSAISNDLIETFYAHLLQQARHSAL